MSNSTLSFFGINILQKLPPFRNSKMKCGVNMYNASENVALFFNCVFIKLSAISLLNFILCIDRM